MAEVSGYVLINGDRNVYHAHKAIASSRWAIALRINLHLAIAESKNTPKVKRSTKIGRALYFLNLRR